VLDGLAPEELRQVLAIARRRTFRRGEVVFHMDDPADSLHLIVSGRFAVRVQTALGDVAILTVLGAGEMFGELALIERDGRRSATVEALEDAETRSIHRPEFERLRAAHPQVADMLVGILATAVRRLSRHLLEALYVPVDIRVRRRLLELAEIYAPAAPRRRSRCAETCGHGGHVARHRHRVLREEEPAVRYVWSVGAPPWSTGRALAARAGVPAG